MFKSAGCNKKREVFKNALWKDVYQSTPQILFHGVNDYYDINLKYARPVKFAKRVLFHRARLTETGISREAENWYTKVQSTKYPNYSFVRMNLEDREQLNQLFETEKFDKVCNLAAQAGVRYSLENPHAYINSNIVGFMNILEACPVE